MPYGMPFAHGCAHTHLNFHIAGGQRQITSISLNEHIGKHWQGLTPFHDAGHTPESLEQSLPRYG
jgi:hypothetical protein